MAEPPVLEDWKTLLEKQLKITGYSQKDILKIVHLCQDFTEEIQPGSQWVGHQQAFVTRIYRIFVDMYVTRFGEQPPPRPKGAPITEVLLDTPERRKQAIREVALSITKPGDDVSDEAVLEELRRRGMRINAPNPTAIISTILRGFKPQFEKVLGKRGVFRRQQ
jgi:hypothetical protein